MKPKPPSGHPESAGITRELRSPDGKSAPDPASDADTSDADLRTQYERDQSSDAAPEPPREVMRQAKKDLDAGLVDTDLRNTPGLDAERRRELLEREKNRSEDNSRKP